MWWFRRSQSPVSVPQLLSAEEQQRLRKRCVAPVKALQSCLRANPGTPLACERLETRAVECFAEVAAPQQAQAFKECYLTKIAEQNNFASSDCHVYVTAMADALKARQCYPLR